MSQQKQPTELEKAVTKQIANYLFESPKDDDEGHFLDMRTRVETKEMNAALLYYRVLGRHFKSKAANLVANILESLAISNKGDGRHEGVISLLQKLPSAKQVPGGMDELMQKLQSGEFLGGESASKSES